MDLELELQRGKALEQQLRSDPRILSSFKARRVANRNIELEQQLQKREEGTRGRLMERLSPEERTLAQDVDTPLLKQMIAKKLERSLLPEQAKPLSPEGKRQADVRAGLLSPEQAQANKFQVPKFTDETLGQQAEITEQTALANAQAGNFKLANAQRSTARAIRKEQGLIDKDVGKLSEKVEKIGFTGLVDSLESALNIINKQKAIEGFGAGSLKPDIALSTEGKQLRQSIATVRNSILQARGGKAITPLEAKNLLEELGTGKGRTDEQLRIGLQKVIDTFKSKLGNIQSGVKPEALQVFSNRGDDPFARLNALKVENFKEVDLKNISNEELLEGF